MFHFPDGGPELLQVNVEPVGGGQGLRSGGLSRGIDWGCCCDTGSLDSDPCRKVVSTSDFARELLAEMSLPEARLDLGCVEALDAA